MTRNDGLVAGIVTGVALLGLAVGTLLTDDPRFRADALSVAVAVVQGGVLLWRRSHPLLALTAASAAVAVHGLAGHPNVASELGPFVAAFAVGAHARNRLGPALVLAAAVGLGLSGAGFALSFGPTPPERIDVAVSTTVIFAVLFLAGRLIHARRRAAEDQLMAALAEERTRIARELHDVIAHHVGAMVIHAGAARRLLDKPDGVARTKDALELIERSGRSALNAVPVLVGALRGDADDSIAPQPTLDRLDEIIEPAVRAGLEVHLDVDGARRMLPASVELSAYRIIQEAMTNVAKHAGPAAVDIRVRYLPEGLDISVVDNGAGCSPSDLPSGGYGLAGMRERAALLGGRFDAGPRSQGGFAVHAWLPAGAA